MHQPEKTIKETSTENQNEIGSDSRLDLLMDEYVNLLDAIIREQNKLEELKNLAAPQARIEELLNFINELGKESKQLKEEILNLINQKGRQDREKSPRFYSVHAEKIKMLEKQLAGIDADIEKAIKDEKNEKETEDLNTLSNKLLELKKERNRLCEELGRQYELDETDQAKLDNLQSGATH
jgi:DNA repair exonuclease SbcCD ATPase subunit